jgi:hypothetical protein
MSGDTIKIRLWGLPAHVAQTAAWLRAQGLSVVRESRDYGDRDGEWVRRYLTVQVPGGDGGRCCVDSGQHAGEF